jgi:hypothetical protein
MGFVSDLLYRKNRKHRQMVQDLVMCIGGEIRFIERMTNDTIKQANELLGVQRGPVQSSGKTVYNFLQEVRQAYDELSRHAKAQYGQLLSADVDTSVIENVRRKVLGLDLCAGVRELEIAGLTVGQAVWIVTSMVMTGVTECLERLACMSASNLGGLVAGNLVGGLVFVIWEAIAGYAEGVEMEHRIKELMQAEETLRANSDAIGNCAAQLRVALTCMQVKSGNMDDRKDILPGYVSPLIICASPLLRT